jgi:hypothetical protein
MPRWPKIYWVGEGSRIDGLHTKKEFLRIMRDQHWNMVQYRIRKQPVDPTKIKKQDLGAWMEFVGAEFH